MKRGINLGCGRITLPCEQPFQHKLLPEFLYTSTDIQWDNVDRNQQPGVSHIANLFDYPWRFQTHTEVDAAGGTAVLPSEEPIPSNTYDYAIATHIVEHIPHDIVEYGTFYGAGTHPRYQDGWFYWFAELNRILKPGGTAWFITPFAFTNGGVADPTHTRYVLPASFNYLVPNDESTFEYKGAGGWKPINFNTDWGFHPHEIGQKRIMESLRELKSKTRLTTGGSIDFGGELLGNEPDNADDWDVVRAILWLQSFQYLNTIAEFSMKMVKVGGNGGTEDHS